MLKYVYSRTYRVLSVVPQYKNTGKPSLAETGLKAQTIRLISGMMDKTLLGRKKGDGVEITRFYPFRDKN